MFCTCLSFSCTLLAADNIGKPYIKTPLQVIHLCVPYTYQTIRSSGVELVVSMSITTCVSPTHSLPNKFLKSTASA